MTAQVHSSAMSLAAQMLFSRAGGQTVTLPPLSPSLGRLWGQEQHYQAQEQEQKNISGNWSMMNTCFPELWLCPFTGEDVWWYYLVYRALLTNRETTEKWGERKGVDEKCSVHHGKSSQHFECTAANQGMGNMMSDLKSREVLCLLNSDCVLSVWMPSLNIHRFCLQLSQSTKETTPMYKYYKQILYNAMTKNSNSKHNLQWQKQTHSS